MIKEGGGKRESPQSPSPTHRLYFRLERRKVAHRAADKRRDLLRRECLVDQRWEGRQTRDGRFPGWGNDRAGDREVAAESVGDRVSELEAGGEPEGAVGELEVVLKVAPGRAQAMDRVRVEDRGVFWTGSICKACAAWFSCIL